MGLSKEQVKCHISGIEKRLHNELEVCNCFTSQTLHGPGQVKLLLWTLWSGMSTFTMCFFFFFQRKRHGYEFAKLCFQVQDYENAIKYSVQ